MALETQRARHMSGAAGRSTAIDAGLRQYMLRVYNYMALGLLLTGIVAMAVASSEAMVQAVFGTPLKWVVMLAPIGVVWFLAARVDRLKASTAQAIFWGYAALMGVSLAAIFVAYTGQSVARVFFITAATFAGVSLFGYTTRKDLSGWGSFLFMGLIGLIIASIVNIVLASSMMQFVISAAGVLIFTGLTAYDTQRIKELYYQGDGSEVATRKAVMGALALYLDFINLFIMMMSLLGERR